MLFKTRCFSKKIRSTVMRKQGQNNVNSPVKSITIGLNETDELLGKHLVLGLFEFCHETNNRQINEVKGALL